MIAVPAATPQKVPVPEPIVATEVLLLVQLPPESVLERVEQLPTHTRVVPVIAPGHKILTVVVE